MNELSRNARDTHGLPVMLLNDYIRDVTSTVTNVMAFTEECLTVFWIYAYALFCVYFGL